RRLTPSFTRKVQWYSGAAPGRVFLSPIGFSSLLMTAGDGRRDSTRSWCLEYVSVARNMHHILRGPTSPSGIAMTSSPSFDPTARSPSSTGSNGSLPTSMMSPRTRGSLWLRLEALERIGAVRRLAADCTFALVRRFVAVRRLAVVCGFAAARRFNGARFFRDKRDVAARFLRFAIGCFLSEISILSKGSQRGNVRKSISTQRVRIESVIYGGTRRPCLVVH